MSVPIAVVGEVPKIRISSGVIKDPPPVLLDFPDF
jgi:hypothetical protein